MNSQSLSTRLAKCLKEVLPLNATDVSVHYIHKLKEQGASATMYSFVLTYISEGVKQRKDLVLRMYGKYYEKDAPKEFAVLKTLKEHNLPVPTAYYFEADNGMMGKPFMVMEKIAGRSASHYLNDEVKGQIIVDKMAKILVRVHKLDPNCIKGSNVMGEQEQLQRDLLKIRFFINKFCMDFLGFCPLRLRRFIAAVKRLEEVKPKKSSPAILHRDYVPDHVLVSNGRFTVVDWGAASIGDPAYDVAWAYHHLRLRTGMAKVDLGGHFVKSYEKYMGQRLVNLQFFKNMLALELAWWSRLLPFHARVSKFRNYAKLVDLTFGNIFGKLLGPRELHRMQKLYAGHHSEIFNNIEHVQSYVIQYLERDRYGKTN